MATPLDTSLLQSFSGLFLFIMVFAITYAVLGLTNVLGKDKRSINATVAFCMALFLTFSSKPNQVISAMTPWVAMILVLVMFMLLAMRFAFGADEGDKVLMGVLGGKTGAGWWIFLAVMGVFLVAISSAVGPEVTPGGANTTSDTSVSSGSGSTATGNWQTNILNTIYHPKILGAVVVLSIALAAVKLLTGGAAPLK